VLSCPGSNFTIPHNPNPLGDDVLPTLGGHLYIHSPFISLIGGGHVYIPSPVPEPTNFSLSLLYDPIEPVDTVVGLFEVLVGEGCLLVHSGDEAIGHSMCSGLKVVTHIHAEDCFGCAGQHWQVWALGVRVDMDVKGRQQGNFLHGWSGERGDILDQRC